MKTPGYVLAIIGIIVGAAGALNHFFTLGLPVLTTMQHGNVIAGAVGLVLLVVGGVMAMQGGGSSAKA